MVKEKLPMVWDKSKVLVEDSAMLFLKLQVLTQIWGIKNKL